MLRSRLVRLKLLCVIVVCAVLVNLVNAQDVEPLVIAATEDGITLPEAWVSGMTAITLQNDTEIAFQPTLARFIDGATMEDFTAAMMAQDFAGMLATVSALGSVTAEPGESASVTYDLQAGDYLFLNFSPAGPPTLIPFTVMQYEGDAVEAPEADVEIVMVDFAFAMPVELTTGDAVWHFTNEGEQTHEIVIFSVDEDATVEGVTNGVTEALMSAGPGAPPEFPYEEAFSFIGMSPGENAWMNVNLEPGTYAALCFIPDVESEEMTTHLAHGMITIFTVGE
ncbi:MAG: hypothetical protein KME04_04265 [Pleurocapsa minor GSE-CHR-MK-17-07R]|jgi:hypothetical protein|nr:hypothetical protein [Pleurocapsa minor GSE-CHR-MK 17-07R]